MGYLDPAIVRQWEWARTVTLLLHWRRSIVLATALGWPL